MNTALNYDILSESQDDLYYRKTLQEEKMLLVDDVDRFDSEYDYLDIDEVETKSLNALSVYDLGGADHVVWISRNSKFGFDIEVINEDGTEDTLFKEEGIHPYAIESMAVFCRRFLSSYSNLLDKEMQCE